MDGTASDSTTFLVWNLILIAGLLLVIFVFFLLLMRKRWKQNFLHVSEMEEEKKKRERGKR